MAPIFKLVALLSFSLHVAAQGTQFITGTCASDAECASGCCSFQAGKCAAPFVANERGEGCGFGESQPNNNALNGQNGNANANAQASATQSAAAPAQSAPATGNGAGNGAGKQFITGTCTSDADCAAGCCAFNTGKCAGPVVAQERDGGCGFGDAQPNDNAAKALQGRRLGRRGAAYM
ncbi:Nn.00g099720.m01.CDS01 [Neocucurbitaria sp. VM-36]